jgi:hypothetical protein
MADHIERPNFFTDPIDSEQFFKDKAKERGLDIPKTPSRSQMIADKDTQDRFNNPNQPTQLGNVNENNILFDILFGAPVISKGFKLIKNPNIVRKIINKGKDLASSRVGKFITKHADDILMINSLGNTKK